MDSPSPEPEETISAQVEAFKEGRKPAILITKGGVVPDVEGEKAELPEGVLIYKDPESLEQAKAGRMGLALGYGIANKPFTGIAITARNKDGVVIQDVETDGSIEALEAAVRVAGPDGTVEHRPVIKALMERHKARDLVHLAEILGDFLERTA